MNRTSMVTGLALALLAGCIPGPPELTSDAGKTVDPKERVQFDNTVAPLLQQRCAGCHVGPETSATDMFLGTAETTDSFYKGVTDDRRVNGGFAPPAAELLTKGAHSNVVWWSAAEDQTISTWLLAEASARGDGGGGGGDAGTIDAGGGGKPTSARAAEQQWASCLAVSTDAYNSTQAFLIGQMQSEAGRCYSCHSPGGAGGAYWSVDKTDMLAKWQQEIFITAPFQAAAVTGTPVTYKMIAGKNKICNKGQEKSLNAGTHPSYDCNQTVNGVKPIDALDAFTTAVQANEDAGKCPAPGMFAPPT